MSLPLGGQARLVARVESLLESPDALVSLADFVAMMPRWTARFFHHAFLADERFG